MDVIQFLTEIWDSYINDLKPIDQFLATLPFAAYSLGIVAWVRRRYLGLSKDISMELAEEKEASKKWLDKFNKAQKELHQVAATLPENWRDTVRTERKSGNEVRALGYLRDEMNTVAPHLKFAAEELMDHHLSVYPDMGDPHLLEAKRYCRLAILLGGAEAKLETKLEEIETLISESHEIPEQGFDDWDDLQLAYSNDLEFLNVCRILNKKTYDLLEAGEETIAFAVNKRAMILASRSGDNTSSTILEVRYWNAQHLHFSSRHNEALEELYLIEKALLNSVSETDKRVVMTRDLKVQVLDAIGKYEESYEVLVQLENTLGDAYGDDGRHPHLKAWVLVNLRRYEEASAELDRIEHLLQNWNLRDADPPISIVDHLRDCISKKTKAIGEFSSARKH